MDTTTRAIIRQLEGLGWILVIDRSPGEVVIRAAHTTEAPQFVRVLGEDGLYHAVCNLADAAGIDLMDG